jgi:protein-tyrosine phosphatase
MSWETIKSQTASLVPVATDRGELSIILCRREEARSEVFYHQMENNLGKRIIHVACAGNRIKDEYPRDKCCLWFPMYYNEKKREETLSSLWRICLSCAEQNQAVVIHCNNSFHRGPMAAAAIMIKAGYTKESAFREIGERRIIYFGHTVPYGQWPSKYWTDQNTKAFVECQAWLDSIKRDCDNKPPSSSTDASPKEKSCTSGANRTIRDGVTPLYTCWEKTFGQKESIIRVPFKNEELTIVIASKMQAREMQFYETVETNMKKSIACIVFTGGREILTYPVQRPLIHFPIYYCGEDRDQGLTTLWEKCQILDLQNEAILIHCSNGFYRSPIATAALMMMTGYTKEKAFTEIAKQRYIYEGHLKPFEEWPGIHQKHWHTNSLLEAHEWLKNYVPQIIISSKTRTDIENQYQRSSSAARNIDSNRIVNRWCCWTCRSTPNDLKRCGECDRYECKRCRYWCTGCPWNYCICASCNAKGIYLEKHKKTWTCTWCAERNAFRRTRDWNNSRN